VTITFYVSAGVCLIVQMENRTYFHESDPLRSTVSHIHMNPYFSLPPCTFLPAESSSSRAGNAICRWLTQRQLITVSFHKTF